MPGNLRKSFVASANYFGCDCERLLMEQLNFNLLFRWFVDPSPLRSWLTSPFRPESQGTKQGVTQGVEGTISRPSTLLTAGMLPGG
jgi:hypothetical protein